MKHTRCETTARRAAELQKGDARLESLRSEWQRLLQGLDAPVADAGRRLALRIGIEPGVPIRDWTDHFSPLMLLYARLQTEGLRIHDHDRREADLAHLCFLVSTFCDDRARDGQVRLTASEEQFVHALRDRGWCTLDSMTRASTALQDWVARLTHEFAAASRGSYEPMTGAWHDHVSVRRVAAARGYPGLLMALALAGRGGADSAHLRAIKGAFDRLMLGLQWLDDLVDWREDLAMGDVNLLLDLLRLKGPDARQHPPTAIRTTNVGFALVSHGVLDRAASHAVRWLLSAASRQRSLGCPALANMIESRADFVRRCLAREEKEIMKDVLARIGALRGNSKNSAQSALEEPKPCRTL